MAKSLKHTHDTLQFKIKVQTRKQRRPSIGTLGRRLANLLFLFYPLLGFINYESTSNGLQIKYGRMVL